MFDSPASDIVPMPNFMGWYEKNNLRSLRAGAQFYASQVADKLRDIPPGYRVMQARWVLQYEAAMIEPWGADPLPVFENGGLPVGRGLMMYKPLGNLLKQRGLFLDAIYIDFEAGFSFWQLSPEQFRKIFASPKARANMPANIRNLRPEQLIWGEDAFDTAAATRWHRWQTLMIIRAMRRIFIESNLFNLPKKRGGPLVQPSVMNLNYFNPTWRVYDENGWPQSPFSLIDNRSSCCAFSIGLSGGGRYINRTHHHDWNAVIDHLNWARSIMNRPDSRLWAIMLQPIRVHPWLMEQLIAHMTRTGVNWAGSRSAYIYFSEREHLRPQSDPIMVDIMKRHDRPFPRLRGLPEIPLDSDRFETAGFVTTYEDFIRNVTPDAIGGGGDSGNPDDRNGMLPAPLRITPYSVAA